MVEVRKGENESRCYEDLPEARGVEKTNFVRSTVDEENGSGTTCLLYTSTRRVRDGHEGIRYPQGKRPISRNLTYRVVPLPL